MINQSKAFSRPAATAALLAPFADDAHRFTNKAVLLTGDQSTLKTQNGALCFLNCLRLLPRMVSHVDVVIPSLPNDLLLRAKVLAAEIQFGRQISFLDHVFGWDRYDAILSVGTSIRKDLPWTAINSNGWIARVSSGGQAIPGDTEQCNPVGALGAAAFGVADVFKRLIKLRSSRAELFNGLQFSFYDYATSPNGIGPELPKQLRMPASLLAGCGALGNGIALLLSQLNPAGVMWLVDSQDFGEENLGTCVLLGPTGMGQGKVRYLKNFLEVTTDLSMHPLHSTIEEVRKKLEEQGNFPKLVLGGFDNVEARHQLQEIWPDYIFDGAIGDFGAQVCSHVWADAHPCLKCQFIEPPQESPFAVGARLTGLTAERIANADDVVNLEDVARAPENFKKPLKERVGKRICSVVQEAQAKALSSEPLREKFSPSVPFVACASAALVVGKALRQILSGKSVVPTRFMFDVLVGPNGGEAISEPPRKTCKCVTHRTAIQQWRDVRS